MKRTLLALMLMTAMTAGCGDAAPSYGSASQVADALGCTDLSVTEAKLVKEAGVCDMEGERVAIFVFADAKQRDDWLSFGERFAADLIVGPDWAVDPPEGRASEVEEALL